MYVKKETIHESIKVGEVMEMLICIQFVTCGLDLPES